VEWEKGGIRYYIDGVERHQVNEEVTDQPMFMLVNLVVGGG
jgi:beta-glucanase (GH16 family)